MKQTHLYRFLLGVRGGLSLVLAIAPLIAIADLPQEGFPLGRDDLPEIRTVNELRPGLTHVRVERGGVGRDGTKWAFCNANGPQSDPAVLAPVRDCFERVGFAVHEYRIQERPDSEPLYMVFAGEFDTYDEAHGALDRVRDVPVHIRQPASLVSWETGPWTLDMVIVDPNEYQGKVVFAQSGTAYRMSPSDMARKRNAVVAMNASFFEYSQGEIGGIPTGISITQGEWRHEHYPEEEHAPIVFIDDDEEMGQRLWIDDKAPPPPVIQWADGGTTSLDGIDRMPGYDPKDLGADEIVAMRQDVVGTSTLSHGFPKHILVAHIAKDGRLIQGRSPPKGGPTLMATGRKQTVLREALASGRRAELNLKVPGRPGLNAFYVAPVFIKDGQPTSESWWSINGSRFARTMIGADAEGKIYLIVAHVDGLFEPPVGKGGIGVTLEELNRMAHFLGLVHAGNFDGGASSTITVEGRVAQGAIDYQLDNGHGVDRPVGGAVLVIDGE